MEAIINVSFDRDFRRDGSNEFGHFSMEYGARAGWRHGRLYDSFQHVKGEEIELVKAHASKKRSSYDEECYHLERVKQREEKPNVLANKQAV